MRVDLESAMVMAGMLENRSKRRVANYVRECRVRSRLMASTKGSVERRAKGSGETWVWRNQIAFASGLVWRNNAAADLGDSRHPTQPCPFWFGQRRPPKACDNSKEADHVRTFTHSSPCTGAMILQYVNEQTTSFGGTSWS